MEHPLPVVDHPAEHQHHHLHHPSDRLWERANAQPHAHGVNLAFILAWDGLALFLNVRFMAQGRWFLYLPALALTAYITYFALDVLFAFDVRWVDLAGYSWVVYFAVLGSMTTFYSFVRRDMGMVTLVALSLLVVMVAWVGRELAGIDEFLAFFGTGTFTLLATTALAYGLLSLQRFWEQEEVSA
ncbi:MAG UNVERIFIED_CONTAM: hypothetical protein LVT10_17920 [Anaerolineae bacterium]